jgi:HPt (histidine-containing phosphotransfer) domain-containing protein
MNITEYLKIENAMVDCSAIEALLEVDQSPQKKLLVTLIDMFHQSAPEMLNDIKNHHLNNKTDEARMVAHTLKSNCANLGLNSLRECCAKIERGQGDTLEWIKRLEIELPMGLNEMQKIKQILISPS